MSVSDSATGLAAGPTITAAGNIDIQEADIQRYEEDGAVCLRGLFSEALLDRLREATETLLAGDLMNMGRKGDRGKFVGDLNVFQKSPSFEKFAFEGPSWAIAQRLMRASQVRFFADQLFVKEPGTQSPTPWHHDQTYWPVVGDHVCSVWVTMDPVTRESSGLEYIKGSHRWGRRFRPQAFSDGLMESMAMKMLRSKSDEKIPDIDSHRDQYEFLSWDMEPGDCLVHHSLAVHGASGNGSNIRRRAISTRWFGEQAFFSPKLIFSVKAVGLEPGAQMTSPMFPVVPLTGEPVLPWPKIPGKG